MNINDTFLLVNVPPYYTFTINETKPVKFIKVTIVTEIKNVPSEFEDNTRGTGYLAKGSDGHMYGYDYPRYGYSSWTRYLPDNVFDTLSEEQKDEFVKDLIWHDIINYQCPAKAKVCNDINMEFIDYCEKHQHHFYIRTGCKRCNANMASPKIIMNQLKHNWFGWY